MKRTLFTLSIISALVLALSSIALAETTVKLAWDYASPPSDLAGFRIYQADGAGNYKLGKGNELVDVSDPAARSVTLPGKYPDGTYHWVATAYDKKGNESKPSNPADGSFDTTAPDTPANLK
ncbi:MAG: hypothetical protein HGB17_14710, partial [Syntrophobacteraceae bacterium]|nr:hypothetical protein [Syntrophobacteraceae bacterium]